MSKSYRLSRLSFIASSGAFLAACGVRHGAVLPLSGSVAPRGVRDIASAKAGSKRRLQHSSSSSGHAVAFHTKSGKFVYSIAFGPAFVRRTYHDGRQEVIDRAIPQKRGWHRYENGGAYRAVRSKDGTLAICGVSSRRTKHYVYSTGSDLVVISPGLFAVSIPMHGPNATAASAPIEKLHSLMDNVGTWAHDDDFSGNEGEHPSGSGYLNLGKSSKSRRNHSSTGMTPSSSRRAETIDSSDPSDYTDPSAGSLDPLFDLGLDPFDLPADLAADPNAIDPALDTSDTAFDIPDDTLLAKNKCDHEIVNVQQATHDLTKAQEEARGACHAGAKGYARSPMGAGARRKPPHRPPNYPCIHAGVDVAAAVAALGKANADLAKCKAKGLA